MFVIDGKGNQLYAGAISSVLVGDVDGDDVIAEADRALLLNYLAACINLSPNAVAVTDMDQSGAIDVFDLKSMDDILD